MNTQTLTLPRCTQFSPNDYARSSPHDLRSLATNMAGKYPQTAKELKALADYKEEQMFLDPKRIKLAAKHRA
jgi:hypothetical protein